MSFSDHPSSYIVGSDSNEDVRHQQAEQAAQAFIDLPAVDRPFVICRSWDGQKWTSRIIARTREGANSVWLKVLPSSVDAAFSEAYAALKKSRITQAGQK